MLHLQDVRFYHNESACLSGPATHAAIQESHQSLLRSIQRPLVRFESIECGVSDYWLAGQCETLQHLEVDNIETRESNAASGTVVFRKLTTLSWETGSFPWLHAPWTYLPRLEWLVLAFRNLSRTDADRLRVWQERTDCRLRYVSIETIDNGFGCGCLRMDCDASTLDLRHMGDVCHLDQVVPWNRIVWRGEVELQNEESATVRNWSGVQLSPTAVLHLSSFEWKTTLASLGDRVFSTSRLTLKNASVDNVPGVQHAVQWIREHVPKLVSLGVTNVGTMDIDCVHAWLKGLPCHVQMKNVGRAGEIAFSEIDALFRAYHHLDSLCVHSYGTSPVLYAREGCEGPDDRRESLIVWKPLILATGLASP
jgi:hypothetical protein